VSTFIVRTWAPVRPEPLDDSIPRGVVVHVQTGQSESFVGPDQLTRFFRRLNAAEFERTDAKESERGEAHRGDDPSGGAGGEPSRTDGRNRRCWIREVYRRGGGRLKTKLLGTLVMAFLVGGLLVAGASPAVGDDRPASFCLTAMEPGEPTATF
jgi:hypothetical protein